MNGRTLPASAVAGLLEAILHRCTDRDVCLACAAILAHGADPAAVTQYTTLLAGTPDPGPLPPGHGPNHVGNAGQVVCAYAPGECITCHGTVDAAGVFHEATVS